MNGEDLNLHCHETLDCKTMSPRNKLRKRRRTKWKVQKSWKLVDLDDVLNKQIARNEKLFKEAKNPVHEDWIENELMNLIEIKEWMEWMHNKD